MVWQQIKLHWRGFLIGSGVLALCLYVRSCTKAQEEIKHSPLAEHVLTRITVDPEHHHLRIQSRVGKPIDTFLPDHSSTFEVSDTGAVKITSAQWGFEHHFFFGVTMSDFFRPAAGVDLFYFKKLDLGIGVADRIGNYTPVIFAKGSYLIYDNLQLGLTYDNMRHIGAALTVRI